MLNIAQIGCGSWGQNLIRNFFQLKNVSISMVAEIDKERINYVNLNYPQIKTTNEYREILNEPNIDAVVVATEARSHFNFAKQILESDKHVFVEKPLSMTIKQALELVKLAEEKNKVIMVGHTFEYNSAVRYLKDYIKNGNLGKIYYIYSQRLNLGRIRQDINVMWNLAPHDISILLYILEKIPISVSAKGISYIQEGIEDIVFMTLTFEDEITAHIQVSWLDPNKVRKMTVVGSKKMIIYDDVDENKIHIYDKGIDKKNISNFLGEYDDFGKFQLIHRAGDILFPKINFVEPLRVECYHFVDCIINGKKPLTDGYDGLRVVNVLEAAQKSIEKDSVEINIGLD